MRPVRNREHRGCASPLSTGNTQLLHQVPFGDHSVLFRPSSGPAGSSRVRAALLLWGIPICFVFFWGFAGLGRILDHPKSAASLSNSVAILLFLGVVFLAGMILSFRRVARYNREVYPRLRWNWEHTYICRRCGNFQLIPS